MPPGRARDYAPGRSDDPGSDESGRGANGGGAASRRAPTRMRTTTQALVALHGAVFLFGCSGLIGRTVAAPAGVVTCVRSLVGALALGLGLWWWRRHRDSSRPGGVRGRLDRPTRWLLAGAGVLLALHWWAFFAAVQGGSVALGLLTFASYPLFAALLEPVFFREPFRRVDLLACAGVAAGLVLVVPEWRFDTRTGQATLAGLFSGLTFALLSLLNRAVVGRVGALRVVAVETGVAGGVLLPVFWTSFAAVSGRDWAWMILLGVVFTGLAHWAFTASLTRVNVRLAGITSALEPVYGILLAWILLGEGLGWRTAGGGLLIIGAAVFSTGARHLRTPGTVQDG